MEQRKIPLLDLAALHAPLRNELVAEATRVIDSQKFIMGDDVKLLEQSIAEYSHTKYAVGCASGSDALFVALLAAGIRHGDRVLTTTFSFFATAGAITRAGATPVFVDIDPDTFNMDPVQAKAAIVANPRIKAIIPVHLFGASADMDPIMELARERTCVVIEDGAQSIGSEYKGRRTQSIGDVGCISFFPSKNLGCFGDGGMMVTNDEALAKKLAAFRAHGSFKKYYHEYVGVNSRLDTLQAAILRVKLRVLDSWTEGRQKNARRYRELFGADSPVKLPVEMSYQTRHVYNQFVIRCEKRDALKAYLQENGIGSEVYYPLPLHMQPCYQDLGYREGDMPVSEAAALDSLAIPVHSALSGEDLDYIAHVIRAFYA